MVAASPSTKVLFLNYLALMSLLLLTALASTLEPRWLGNSVSLAIALAKAFLIAAVFMHLYYRSLRHRTIALGALLWLCFLVFITLGDYLTRGMIQVPGK